MIKFLCSVMLALTVFSAGSAEKNDLPDMTKSSEAGLFVIDRNASAYDFAQRIYKTLSVDPCKTPLAAARTAERIFIKIYGSQVVKERPWRVTDTNGCYLVCGSLPEHSAGGVAQLKLGKDDGRVWVYLHGK